MKTKKQCRICNSITRKYRYTEDGTVVCRKCIRKANLKYKDFSIWRDDIYGT